MLRHQKRIQDTNGEDVIVVNSSNAPSGWYALCGSNAFKKILRLYVFVTITGNTINCDNVRNAFFIDITEKFFEEREIPTKPTFNTFCINIENFFVLVLHTQHTAHT